jgi:hypothetical protein
MGETKEKNGDKSKVEGRPGRIRIYAEEDELKTTLHVLDNVAGYC